MFDLLIYPTKQKLYLKGIVKVISNLLNSKYNKINGIFLRTDLTFLSNESILHKLKNYTHATVPISSPPPQINLRQSGSAISRKRCYLKNLRVFQQ